MCHRESTVVLCNMNLKEGYLLSRVQEQKRTTDYVATNKNVLMDADTDIIP